MNQGPRPVRAALLVSLLGLAGCLTKVDAPAPAPAQVQAPPPAPPPVEAVTPPPPLTDQPPIAAPTERVGVTPLPGAGPAPAAPPNPAATPPAAVPAPAPGNAAAPAAASVTPAATAPEPPPTQTAQAAPLAPATPVAAAPVPEPAPKPEADARFYAFLAGFRPEVLKAGVKPETYDRAVAGLTPNERVIDLNGAQPEFVRQVWDYLAGAVSDMRVAQGQEALSANAATFDRVEAAYGVPRQVVAAIWGLETGFGRNTGNFPLFQALATLAYDGPRQTFAKREFIAALKIAETEGLDPQTMTSSWAGAFGHTQFIPTTFLAHAVDGDGDGKRDLWNTPADALASTAAYLKESGWKPGETWGEEVRLPENFPYEQADLDIRKPQSEWASLGVRNFVGEPLAPTEDPVAIFLPAGARGPAFVIRDNFRAILRYNNATSYALAIGLLSDRFRGAQGVVAPWPREELALTLDQRIALQESLNALGFSVGEADGILGRATRGAIRSYQKARNLPADGFATVALLQQIVAERNSAPPQ